MRIGRLVQVIILLSSFVTSDVANQLVVSDNICMKRVGMFEAKTKLSELCDEVNRTSKSILVTKRGKLNRYLILLIQIGRSRMCRTSPIR